jgi:hypothetical protein
MGKLQSAIVAALLSLFCAASIAQTDSGAMRINFGGQDFVHRWSKDGQHEYTPPEETDLKKWRHMVTIIVHEKVKNGDDLAKLANAVLGNYERVGKVVRTDSKPRTSATEAEHLVVVIFGRPGFVEAALARVKLVAGVGTVTVYSRREYGDTAKKTIGDWLIQNGTPVETTLMTWEKMPALSALKQLPQAAD